MDADVRVLVDAPVREIREALVGAIADAKVLKRHRTIERKRGDVGVYAQRAVYLAWLDAALPGLLKLALAEPAHQRQLLALAKLASPEPMFDNPLIAWEAQRLRDEVLRDAGLIGAPK